MRTGRISRVTGKKYEEQMDICKVLIGANLSQCRINNNTSIFYDDGGQYVCTVFGQDDFNKEFIREELNNVNPSMVTRNTDQVVLNEMSKTLVFIEQRACGETGNVHDMSYKLPVDFSVFKNSIVAKKQFALWDIKFALQVNDIYDRKLSREDTFPVFICSDSAKDAGFYYFPNESIPLNFLGF